MFKFFLVDDFMSYSEFFKKTPWEKENKVNPNHLESLQFTSWVQASFCVSFTGFLISLLLIHESILYVKISCASFPFDIFFEMQLEITG